MSIGRPTEQNRPVQDSPSQEQTFPVSGVREGERRVCIRIKHALNVQIMNLLTPSHRCSPPFSPGTSHSRPAVSVEEEVGSKRKSSKNRVVIALNCESLRTKIAVVSARKRCDRVMRA